MINFAAPAAAAFGLIGALIIAQYFLKLRRIRKTLPSTFLWKRATINARANTPWQRLRAEPLLLLQIAALVVLTLALMKPYVLHAGSFGSDVVVVLDASITTQADDGGRTRFAREIATLGTLVADLPHDKSVSLVRMDGRPRVLLAASTDRGALASILSSQRPGFEQPEVAAAMNLASALATRTGSAKAAVLVLRSADTALSPPQSPVPYREQTFGSPGLPNIGIDALVAAQDSSGTVTATYRVVNTGRTNLQSDVDIYADGRLEAVEHVSVPARQSMVENSSFLSKRVSILEARMVLPDSLGADNATWTTLQTQGARHVLVVTAGDVFLTTALSATPGTVFTTMTPATYSAASAANQDLTVFDGVVPPGLPRTNVLVIGPPQDVLGVQVGGVRKPSGTVRVDDDPNGLLRYLSTPDVHVFQARIASVPGWAHVALRDAQGPLMFEGTSGGTNGQRTVIVLFSLNESDLALGLNFPVLVSNLLDWLAPAGVIGTTVVHPGAFLAVSLPDDQARVSVTGPDGSLHALLPVSTDQGTVQAVFGGTDLPGAYTVHLSSGPITRVAHFVVDPELQPVAGPATVLSAAAHSAPGQATNAKVPYSLTSAVALIVIGILAAEWLVAMRVQ